MGTSWVKGKYYLHHGGRITDQNRSEKKNIAWNNGNKCQNLVQPLENFQEEQTI